MSDEGGNERGDAGPERPGNGDGDDRFRLEVGLEPLRVLLEALASVGRRDGATAETGVNVSTVDEFLDQRRTEAAEQERDARKREAEADEYHVDTRWDGDSFVVVADVPGATLDELSVGIDPRTGHLVIDRAGTTVGRVDVPWESPEATRAWFQNGVLEIRLRPAVA